MYYSKRVVDEIIIICIRICYEQSLTLWCGILCIRHSVCNEQRQPNLPSIKQQTEKQQKQQHYINNSPTV